MTKQLIRALSEHLQLNAGMSMYYLIKTEKQLFN